MADKTITTKKLVERYTYLIEYSDEDECFIARCAELSTLAAHGESQEKALSEVKKAAKIALDWLKDEDKELPVPFSLKSYSGEYRLRISPETHREIAIKASLLGVSMNQYIASKL